MSPAVAIWLNEGNYLGVNQRSYSTLGTDHLLAGKPSRYVTSHPGQLSLANPTWVGAISTSKRRGVHRPTT